MEWLRRFYEPHSQMLISPGKERLLIPDGHSSHVNKQLIDFCESHNVALFWLSPHSTHLLQPLDIGLFGPLQHFYRIGIDDYFRDHGENFGLVCFDYFIYIPLHVARRTMAAAVPLPLMGQRQAFLFNRFLPLTSSRSQSGFPTCYPLPQSRPTPVKEMKQQKKKRKKKNSEKRLRKNSLKRFLQRRAWPIFLFIFLYIPGSSILCPQLNIFQILFLHLSPSPK